MCNKLTNKVALITGGSRGIGAAIALDFAREGADIVFSYISATNKAQEMVKKIEALGRKAVAVQGDVSKEEDAKGIVDTAVKAFGHIDILVNNAGTIGEEYALEDMPIEEWNHVFNIDLGGVFLVTKFAIPHMRENKPSKIINISSSLANSGRAKLAHYCAAKAAVMSLSKSLSLELTPDILVNSIAPGAIATDMILADMAAEWIPLERYNQLQRLGKPEEISAVAVLLASDGGNFITGQAIYPNGGFEQDLLPMAVLK